VFRVFLLLANGDRAIRKLSNNQHRQLVPIIAPTQTKSKCSKMDFPRFSYSPLRPHTTIAIDQVNTTNSETQPSVKIAIVLILLLI
jgi:hypothetical protein